LLIHVVYLLICSKFLNESDLNNRIIDKHFFIVNTKKKLIAQCKIYAIWIEIYSRNYDWHKVAEQSNAKLNFRSNTKPQMNKIELKDVCADVVGNIIRS